MRKPNSTIQRRSLGALAVCAAALALGLLLSACGGSSKQGSPPPSSTTATTETTPATLPATTTTAKPSRLSPAAKLLLALGKAPAQTSLPKSLRGSKTGAVPLSSGSRKHHAAGAIATTNGGTLVGYLVFKKRSDALADLRAYPPSRGPNEIIARSLSGLPKPTYVLKALGN